WQLPPRPGLDRPAGRPLAEPTPGPPARARLLAEPDRDLLLGRATQSVIAQRLHRPGRGRSSPAGLPAPLRADRGAVRLALHQGRPRPASSPTRRPPPADLRRMTTTHELPYGSTKRHRLHRVWVHQPRAATPGAQPALARAAGAGPLARTMSRSGMQGRWAS